MSSCEGRGILNDVKLSAQTEKTIITDILISEILISDILAGRKAIPVEGEDFSKRNQVLREIGVLRETRVVREA